MEDYVGSIDMETICEEAALLPITSLENLQRSWTCHKGSDDVSHKQFFTTNEDSTLGFD